MALSTVRKGTGFELRVAELFKQKGYDVTHNVKMSGRSGAAHQIDVLAQFKAPLHTSTVIVEAKHHSANIDKDTIMKLIHIQQDLSADRAVLATTSGFTSGAMQTAQQYGNLELWDGVRMTSLLGEVRPDAGDGGSPVPADSARTVDARFTMQEARRHAEDSAEKRSRGGMFGRGRIEESVRDVRRFLYPYYEVDMDAKVRQVEKTGWFSKENVVSTVSGRIGVDGNTGSVVHAAHDGISYEYSYLGGLSGDEITVLHHAVKEGEFEKRNLSPEGWTAQRTNRAVNGLAGKGLLVQKGQRPATYEMKVEYPHDPSVFKSPTERFQVTESPTEDRKIECSLLPTGISEVLDGLWPGASVKDFDMVYYPYYMAVYERPDGSTRHEILDGTSGARQEYLEGVVSEDAVCGGTA